MELFLLAFAALASAQYPPPPTYDSVIKSPLNSNVTISYKQPAAGTCTTAFTTQKQYSGYIELPPYTLAPIQQNYSINTFFWFVEARQTPETAPLTIWLNGGPGSSSILGMFEENGPCEVVRMSDGTYGTQARMWGWDRSSNVLFIDQPNQVGFSFDEATNQTYDFLNQWVLDDDEVDDAGLPDTLLKEGTFGSAFGRKNYVEQQWTATANTTQIAAQSTWHFLQSWLAAFPQYNPVTRPNVTTVNSNTDDPAGVHLFAESYGGHYGPVFATYFEQQNALRANGSLPMNSTLAIQLESVGIINGLIDELIQDYYYATFPYNNTYGIEAIDQTAELNLITSFSGSGGCAEQINSCRIAMNATDPEGDGDVTATNDICRGAQLVCSVMQTPYIEAGFDPYDIRQHIPSPDPPQSYNEYLNYANVLSAIGARVNFTQSNRYVQNAFIGTGDTIRGGQIADLADLLAKGIRVALIYGDADFICNWLGGEAISLAVAQYLPSTPPAPAPATYAAAFPAAGYADIVINSTYVGGAVRQYGNLSFSRVYDAGHFVPYFQPETAFTIFTRVIFGTDVATGEPIDLSTYGSEGPSNATYNQASASYSFPTPSQTCWLRDINSTCTRDQLDDILGGTGQFVNGIFYASDQSVSLPTSSITGGVPGQPASTETMMSDSASSYTGVYTATSTPSPTGAAAPAFTVWSAGRGFWPAAVAVGALALGIVILL